MKKYTFVYKKAHHVHRPLRLGRGPYFRRQTFRRLIKNIHEEDIKYIQERYWCIKYKEDNNVSQE